MACILISESHRKLILSENGTRVKHKLSLWVNTPAFSLKDAKFQTMQISMKSEVSNKTVDDLREKYWTEIVKPNSKVPNQVKGYLNKIGSEFGHRKIIDIKRSRLVNFNQTYSTDRGARSADRVRSYLKQLFSYAVELGWLETSPMSEVTKRITGCQNIDRDRTLSDDEIKMVWKWDKHQPNENHKPVENVKIIKFLLLTGLRISEAQNGYVDGEKFRIDDTKGKHGKHEKRPHWVYLTKTAKAQLPLPHYTATNIQAWLKRKLLNEKYTDNRFTPQDCRRTFATRANGAGVLPHVVEKCLNHKMAGMMAVYNHAEYVSERIECAKTVEQAILEIIK